MFFRIFLIKPNIECFTLTLCQFFFTQPGDVEMLVEALDGIFSGGVVDANRENRVDDAKGQVVVVVFFCLGERGKIEFVLATGYKSLDFGFGEHEMKLRKSEW